MPLRQQRTERLCRMRVEAALNYLNAFCRQTELSQPAVFLHCFALRFSLITGNGEQDHVLRRQIAPCCPHKGVRYGITKQASTDRRQ
jgi:hypothetical protein